MTTIATTRRTFTVSSLAFAAGAVDGYIDFAFLSKATGLPAAELSKW